jgi:hypothetical protein
MNKAHILEEIKRTAALNGGVALGTERFFQETGIKVSDWMGKVWARWGDAVKEAGLVPNELQGKLDDNFVLGKYASLTQELKYLPVANELKLKAKQDKSFPSHNVFSRLGNKQQLVKKLVEFCEVNSNFSGVLEIARDYIANEVESSDDSNDAATDETFGYVYMLKSGRNYKVGRSNSFERRSREHRIQLPEQADTVHVIQTDDPIGIELYWHRRFEAKRKNGEWFELSTQDVKAFKRRKFM